MLHSSLLFTLASQYQGSVILSGLAKLSRRLGQGRTKPFASEETKIFSRRCGESSLFQIISILLNRICKISQHCRLLPVVANLNCVLLQALLLQSDFQPTSSDSRGKADLLGSSVRMKSICVPF